MLESKFKVDGWHCESCVKVTDLLMRDIPGVKNVSTDFNQAKLSLFADRVIKKDEVQAALRQGEAPYQVIEDLD